MTTMNPYKLLRSSWLASLLGLTALGLVAGPAHAATLTWGTSGTGGEGTWTATDGWWNGTTQQSWSNATPDDAIFGGTGGAVTLAGGTTTAGSITFDPFAGSYTIGTASQALTINGGGITMNSGAGTVTFQNSPITLGAAQSWTNNSSSLLTVSSGITNGGNLLTVAGSGNATLADAIAGTGGITKNGSGVLTLSATNTHTGTTTVNAGLLTSPANAGAVVRLSSFGTGPIEIGASGTVQMTGWNGQNLNSANAYYVNGYTNAVSGSGVLALEGQSGSFSVNYSGDLSGFSGTISATAAAGTYVGVGNTGSEAIRLSGSSTRFVVSGGGTLLPVITSAGTIALGELSGDGIVSARNGVASTWQVGGLSTSSTFSGRLTDNGSGALALTKVGSGTLTLSGSSSFSGGARVDAGTLAFGALTALGSGTVTLGGGALQSAVAGTLANPIAITAASGTFDSQANTNTLSGTISGAADFVKIGSGTLTLAAANTYSGDTRVSAGALRLAAAGSFADSGRIIVGDAGSSGAVLDLTAKTSFAIGADQTLMGGGTALLGASTALTVSGTFSPGNSPGLFTYDGGSTTLAGTTLLEVWGTTRATSPSHGDGFYDAVNVIDGGLLTLGGALVLDFDQNFADSASFLLFDTLTNGSLAGGFGSIMIRGLNNDYAGLSFTQAGNVWTTGFNFNNQGLRLTQTSSSVVLDVIVVPEPGAIALAGCGVALAGWIAARHSRRR